MAEARGSATRPDGRAPERAGIASAASAARRAVLVRWRALLWGVATIVVFALVAVALERKVTWYLAVDQLGALLFAHDLLHGRIFHDWPVATALATWLPPQADVLAQTYVWDRGVLYSRYAPGYPLLMAGWIALFGDGGAHLLNPLIFLVLLGVLIGFGWRVHRSPAPLCSRYPGPRYLQSAIAPSSARHRTAAAWAGDCLRSNRKQPPARRRD